MKKLLVLVFTLLLMTYSQTSNAIQVWCHTGSFAGLSKTAYVQIQTDLDEYFFPGYYYAMAISTDLNANITGEYARGFHKPAFRDVYSYVWLRAPYYQWRKVLASAGLYPRSEKSCNTNFVQLTP